jgi:hypothetical protein
MDISKHRLLLLLVVLTVALPAGCREQDSGGAILEPQGLPADAAPDFTLLDINSASPRYDELVSPRDYVGRISAWYFGHST